jgi:hypothetical protein
MDIGEIVERGDRKVEVPMVRPREQPEPAPAETEREKEDA